MTGTKITVQLIIWKNYIKLKNISRIIDLSIFRVGGLGVPLPMVRRNVAQGLEPNVLPAPNLLREAGWGQTDTLSDILQDGRLDDIISNIQNRAQRTGQMQNLYLGSYVESSFRTPYKQWEKDLIGSKLATPPKTELNLF